VETGIVCVVKPRAQKENRVEASHRIVYIRKPTRSSEKSRIEKEKKPRDRNQASRREREREPKGDGYVYIVINRIRDQRERGT